MKTNPQFNYVQINTIQQATAAHRKIIQEIKDMNHIYTHLYSSYRGVIVGEVF